MEEGKGLTHGSDRHPHHLCICCPCNQRIRAGLVDTEAAVMLPGAERRVWDEDGRNRPFVHEPEQ